MFGLTNSNKADEIVKLDIALLKPHPNDPFKPYTDDKLKELAESITVVGEVKRRKEDKGDNPRC